MQNSFYLFALLLCLATISVAPLPVHAGSTPDKLTPLVVSPLTNNVRPFLGADIEYTSSTSWC